MLLGSKIKQKRKEKGFKTQGDLAKVLRVSHVTVSGWERDEFQPDGTNLLNLMSVLQSDFGLDVKIKSGLFDTDKPYSYQQIQNGEHIASVVNEISPGYTTKPKNSYELDKYIELLIRAEKDGHLSIKKIKILTSLLKYDISLFKNA